MKTRVILLLVLFILSINGVQAGDRIFIVAQNLQNFFYSLDRTRTQNNGVPLSNYTTAEGRQAKAEAIVKALAPYEADIYAFNEVEAKAEGADSEALEVLAKLMTQETGVEYEVVNDGLTYDPSDDATGQIKSGFIYRTDRVALVGDNVSTAVGYTYVYPYMLRMQTFRSISSGESFTLSMNHFKASTSGNMADDQLKREQNSMALLQGLDSAQDPDILILGDLNSEMGEQCLKNLTDAGYEEQILKYDDTEAYSYWWYGGTLIDHVFANNTMARQVADALVLHIANPHSVGTSNAYSDHDPYIITLDLQAQPSPTYTYTKASVVENGKAYLMVAPLDGLKAAKPVSVGKTYEYLQTTEVEDLDGRITMPDAKQAFIFEDAGDGNYYLKDYYGRYIYQYQYNGSYYTNVNVWTKESGHTFTVTPQTDGSFKIVNTASNYYFLFRNESSGPAVSLRNWTTLYSGQYLPYLYGFDSMSTTGIDDVTFTQTPQQTRKVMMDGRLVIVTPDGRRYNLQGLQVE